MHRSSGDGSWGRGSSGRGSSGTPRRIGARLTGALMCSVALVLGGCGVLTTKEDRRFAETLADEHYPGVLRVVEVRKLFPQAGGSEVAFSVTGDPDAVVRIRVDAAAGTCHTHDCRKVLDDAVGRGRSEAARLRLLTRTFRSCGHEVIGVEPSSGAPWIVASPTDATVSRVLDDIGSCVRRWVEEDGHSGGTAHARGASVNIASPAAARRRPAGKKSQPTAMRLSETRLLASLQSRPYFVASYSASQGRIDTTGSARIVQPFETRQRFAATVGAAVRARLRASYPNVRMSAYQGVWRLEPGTVDRLTGYVLYCERPDGEKRCLGDRAVVVTTDARGEPVGEVREAGKVREGRGPLRLPPL
ncbi:SCO7460 family lipoprotein [Streptomyces sp. NPDC091387]|uniref:SCO7460 family lipoprotein n=1 Tax=Streptomyces sp. NPDC091387 TaxID=3365998 RepID=UPI0037F350B2